MLRVDHDMLEYECEAEKPYRATNFLVQAANAWRLAQWSTRHPFALDLVASAETNS